MFKRAEMRPTWRSRSPLMMLVGLSLILAACGDGGGGGGGGGDAAVMRALVVNAMETDATVTYTDAGGTATDQAVETCTAPVLEFTLSDPFQIAVDGTTVVDSTTLPEGVPGFGESDLVVKIDIARDGTAEFDEVRIGRTISPPARSAYCATLPG